MISKITILVFLIFIFSSSSYSFAQESELIPITFSGTMEKIKFDGRWSFEREWKASTLSEISYNDTGIILRSAHQNEFIYVLVDSITEPSLDNLQDNAMICFASKSKMESHNDDYCFVAILGKSTGITLKNSDLGLEQIPSHAQLIAIGNSSDINDRYTGMPHPSYEFRIPVDLFGRSDRYGFFLSIYDANKTKFYNWPTNLTRTDVSSVPDSSYWGEIYSPDKSLPEFYVSSLVLVPALILVVVLTRSRNLFKN